MFFRKLSDKAFNASLIAFRVGAIGYAGYGMIRATKEWNELKATQKTADLREQLRRGENDIQKIRDASEAQSPLAASEENKNVKFTPYSQAPFCKENNIDGICFGLSMKQVTKRGKDEEEAFLLQQKYKQKVIQIYHVMKNQPERDIDEALLKMQAELFIDTNNLHGKTGDLKVMTQDPAYVDNVQHLKDLSRFIKNETYKDSHFGKNVTILFGSARDSDQASHALLLDSNGYDVCRFYDANQGLHEGDCIPVIVELLSTINVTSHANAVAIPRYDHRGNESEPEQDSENEKTRSLRRS